MEKDITLSVNLHFYFPLLRHFYSIIYINGKNETYGFPSKIEDDPVLSFVIKGDRSIDYAEERRLFYVAMTRTKNRVFFIAPEANPSEFLLEIKQSYKNVKLIGDWNEEEPINIAKKACPLCGYPMQLKYKKAYGLRLYICTNEPEVCGFMTNDYRAGKLAIQKCDKCRDGYLIVKQGNNKSFFLGCTNYKRNNTGCNKTVSKMTYYAQMGYKDDNVVSETPKIQGINDVHEVNSTSKEKSLVHNTVCFDEGMHVSSDTLKTDNDNSESSLDYMESEIDVSNDDYVNIIRAKIEPVLYDEMDLNDIVFDTLKALQNISRTRFFGITVLCEVLKGAENEKIEKYNLHAIPEYGLYYRVSIHTIKNIIEWMLDSHYILKTKGRYPVLHSTYEGLHYSESITEEKLEDLKKYLEEKASLNAESDKDTDCEKW